MRNRSQQRCPPHPLTTSTLSPWGGAAAGLAGSERVPVETEGVAEELVLGPGWTRSAVYQGFHHAPVVKGYSLESFEETFRRSTERGFRCDAAGIDSN